MGRKWRLGAADATTKTRWGELPASYAALINCVSVGSGLAMLRINARSLEC